MKLALGVFNSKYVHSSLAPWCLAAAVEQRAPETDCRVLEGTINQPPKKLADAMAALDPDAAGFRCISGTGKPPLRRCAGCGSCGRSASSCWAAPR